MAAACSEYLLFFSHELEQKFLPATLTTEVKVFSVPTVTYLGSSFPSAYIRSSSSINQGYCANKYKQPMQTKFDVR